MASTAIIEEFLTHRRLAFIGVSRRPKEFSAAVYRQLRDRGYDLLPVNPHADEVEGDRGYRRIADLPPDVEGAIVMVPAGASAEVVRQCLDRGIPRVWLHQGVGPSSVSAEAVALCRDHGVPVVDGACPLMFVEPVGWIHRAHRAGRRWAGHLTA